MQIEIELIKSVIPYKFERENDFGFTNDYTGFKVDYTKNTRVYLVAYNHVIRMQSFYKQMIFEDGKVIVKFGKDKVTIGSYKEVK